MLYAGLGSEDEQSLVEAAQSCCEEDIYHFDDTERFFLVSCLAQWYVTNMMCIIITVPSFFVDRILQSAKTQMPLQNYFFLRYARQKRYSEAEKYGSIASGMFLTIHSLIWKKNLILRWIQVCNQSSMRLTLLLEHY